MADENDGPAEWTCSVKFSEIHIGACEMKTTLLMLLFSLMAQASGRSAKLAQDLSSADPSANIPVIIQYVQRPDDTDDQKALNLGGQLKHQFRHLKSAAYTVPATSLKALANDPNVRYVSVDRPIRAKLDYSTAAINAPAAWNASFTGNGVGIAIVDSGVSDVGDLTEKKKRVVYRMDFVAKDGKDEYGHGEHVAGIIAASGKASRCSKCNRSLRGVAPDANIIDLRVLDENGQGSESDVIAAIQTAILLKDVYNIRVLNLSLGRPVYESYTLDPLCQAVEAAWKAGIVVVVAAGNDGRDNSLGTNGYGTITSPGNDPYVITVGAMKTMQTYDRSDDLIASYSSKGPTLYDYVVKPDLVAPGNQVVSLLADPNVTLAQSSQTAVPNSYYQSGLSSGDRNKKSQAYITLNGTSMAAALVSGAVADLLQAQPKLTPDQVKARLMKTANKTFPLTSVATDPLTGQTFTSNYDIFTVGAGYLDLQAALASTDVAGKSALSPTAVLDAASGKIYISSDASAVWNDQTIDGTRGVWGTRSVWGTSVIDADRAVWGTRGVWGTSDVAGARGVWGTSAGAVNSTTASSSVIDSSRGVWATSGSSSDGTSSVLVNGEN